MSETSSGVSTKASASYTKFQFERTILQQFVQLKWLRSPNRLNPAENPPYAEMNTSHDRTSRGQPLQHNHNVSKAQYHAEMIHFTTEVKM